MLLAQHDIHVSEEEVVQEASFEGFGIYIEELVRLAEHYGLHAEIRELDLAAIRKLLADGTYAIVYLDRTPLDGEFAIHTVIPIRVSQRTVTFLDPLGGERQVPRRLFEDAHRRLAFAAVVCKHGESS
jgi:predicted double-glycine peptidase